MQSTDTIIPSHATRPRTGWLIGALLVLIVAAGAFLRFHHLGEAGMNEYYAAAVKSMLLSWRNFFFVAFEPGGTVSLDKPPLGFWIEAASAYFLGVNGFALTLPNAVAGVLSILVVYKLVQRPFGQWAALAAAAVLSVMPVAVATERNNTIDGMLVFVLLLAAWAFLEVAYSGRTRWLLLGAALVGLGFNIKMLQALMPLPAFYAVYFFGAKRRWWRKVLGLGAASALLVVVSLAWAVTVDLTPAAERPYVDSTSSNSVMELIFGHNGIERLTRSRGAGGAPAGAVVPPSDANARPLAGGPNGGPGMDFGTAGTLRLFTEPLVGEASWMLPFALGGLLMLLLVLARRTSGAAYISLLLWAGWLLPEALYFSYSQGLMHAYYLIMVGAPIAALCGMALWALGELIRANRLFGWSAALGLALLTLGFEAYTLLSVASIKAAAVAAAAAACVLLTGAALALSNARVRGRAPAPVLALLLAAMLAAPALWSTLTTLNTRTSNLPAAGPVRAAQAFQNRPDLPHARLVEGGDGMPVPPAFLPPQMPGQPGEGGVNQGLLRYLLANTQPGKYLLATGRANSAAGYILATGRPVLALGGFLDQYDEMPLQRFTALVQSGQLKFVLGEALDRHVQIANWVTQNCSLVDPAEYGGGQNSLPVGFGGRSSNGGLYQCGS